MKQKKNEMYWVMAFVLAGSIHAFAKPYAVGPYLGQTPPGSTAQVFAPGLICDTRPHQLEAWVSFSADGNTFCFNRGGYVFITENTDQGWTRPKRIKSIPFKTSSCCLSPDANSIYFNYSYDPSKRYSRHRCMRTSRGWSLPQELQEPSINSGSGGTFSLAANNNFYFVSWPFGPHKKGGIFCAPFVDNTWSQAINLSVFVQAKGVGEPGIAPDESFMIVNTKDLPGGYGHQDLYLTLRRPDGTWPEARNLGPRINSAYLEYGARISPDKKYLFFTRANGWGYNSNDDTGDIYWVELKEYLPETYR
ncbi:MAG: hypothetical protein H8D56_09895 [Planctomycetes bacterium]|nr:hypothetical protein [Planctomycetota bacterium]